MADPVARNPVPSLLRSLMTDHLDPGYAEASATRSKPQGRFDAVVLILGVVLVGCVFGVALAQAAGLSNQSGSDTLIRVRDADSRAASLEADRNSLLEEVQAARAAALQDDSGGVSVLSSLEQLEAAAGAERGAGPGIVVTVSEPPTPSDLSDVSKNARRSSEAAVLDRDLQAVVNSLWVCGAEAVSVNDIRIGPGVTIRQAGGAMLVDNRPVFSPYTISAIGPLNRMQAQFSVSDAYLRMSGLEQLYDIGFDVAAAEALEVPASSVRTVRSATQIGEP